MFTTRNASTIKRQKHLFVNANRHAFYCQPIVALIMGSAVMIGLTGCGQKGALYLADTSSQTVTNSSDASASEMIDSTSNPQDAAFAGSDDDDYQNTRYLEQKLAEVSADTNDY